MPEFFSTVYLVDFSPSLCEVARKRFDRLGWTNVKVVCEDARKFHLEGPGADLITMSYSLSMIVSKIIREAGLSYANTDTSRTFIQLLTP